MKHKVRWGGPSRAMSRGDKFLMGQEETPRVSDVDVPMKLDFPDPRNHPSLPSSCYWKAVVPGFLQLSLPVQTFIPSYFLCLFSFPGGRGYFSFTPRQTRSSDDSYRDSPEACGAPSSLLLSSFRFLPTELLYVLMFLFLP